MCVCGDGRGEGEGREGRDSQLGSFKPREPHGQPPICYPGDFSFYFFVAVPWSNIQDRKLVNIATRLSSHMLYLRYSWSLVCANNQPPRLSMMPHAKHRMAWPIGSRVTWQTVSFYSQGLQGNFCIGRLPVGQWIYNWRFGGQNENLTELQDENLHFPELETSVGSHPQGRVICYCCCIPFFPFPPVTRA